MSTRKSGGDGGRGEREETGVKRFEREREYIQAKELGSNNFPTGSRQVTIMPMTCKLGAVPDLVLVNGLPMSEY